MIKTRCTFFLLLFTGSLFAQSPNDAGRLLDDLLAGVNASTGVLQNTSPQISSL